MGLGLLPVCGPGARQFFKLCQRHRTRAARAKLPLHELLTVKPDLGLHVTTEGPHASHISQLFALWDVVVLL